MTTNRPPYQQPSLSRTRSAFTEARIKHWNAVACKDGISTASRCYHDRLSQVYRFLVPEGRRVLDIGCGKGDLLNALCPAYGVGVDFATEMIKAAREQCSGLRFIEVDAYCLTQSLKDEKFDVVILSDVINDLWNVQEVLEQVRGCCNPDTRVILNFYNRLWQLPLGVGQKLGLARPVLEQNWLTGDDVRHMLHLSGFELVRSWEEVLFPLPIPLLDGLMNRFLVKIWPFNWLALSNFMVARPVAAFDYSEADDPAALPSVSIIVPARNEAGNIENIFSSVPEMGSTTELIFVEGHSSDDTFAVIERAIQAHPERRCKLMKQDGKGKGDAVRKGFASAGGDILMILDADLTVPAEELPRFYRAVTSNKAEFVNGVRLVYPMEKEALRFFNFLGNKFFSLAFTWLLGQPVKDTLCGTKVLWRKDYEQIVASRGYFGDFDPFGDFDLLFGAAKLNRKIADLPVRYRERAYGTTNISRWKHGLLLLRMVLFAASRIKFV